MARACRVLRVPVVSGNVSLYNEAQGQAIYPTPIAGGLGLLEDAARHASAAFPEEGLLVVLLGSDSWQPRASDLAGSEYLQVVHNLVKGRPVINLGREKRVQELCRRAIVEDVIASAHDCSDGGLSVALAECCLPSPSGKGAGGEDVGFHGGEAFSRLPKRWDAALFGEGQSRIVVSLRPEQFPMLKRLAAEMSVPVLELGVTGGSRFQLGRYVDLSLEEIRDPWHNGVERALES